MSKAKSDTRPGTQRVVLARLGAAHGLKGEIRITVFAEDPESLITYGPLDLSGGATTRITGLRVAGKGLVARLDGVKDRTAAEALNGVELSIARDRLPDDLDEDDFYYADLIGLDARDWSGSLLGKVLAVHDFGAGDILELRLADGKSAMIPFSRAAVPEIDLAQGQLVVDPAAAGLTDEPEEDR